MISEVLAENHDFTPTSSPECRQTNRKNHALFPKSYLVARSLNLESNHQILLDYNIEFWRHKFRS